MIRVLLVDDHGLFRDGIKRIFSDVSDIGIVGEAEDGNTLLTKYNELLPDVVLTDISMPNRNGLDAVKTLTNKKKGARVLFLSQYGGDDYINSILKAGGLGLISKNVSKEDLIIAIKKVNNGEKYFFGETEDEIKALKKRFKAIENKDEKRKDNFITKREKEVLNFISEGLTNDETAAKLKISVRTVESHRYRLMDKLGLRTISEIVNYANKYFNKVKM